MSRARLLIATRNPHKVEEIRGLLADLPCELLSLEQAKVERRPEEEEIEVYDSFEKNARAKARYYRGRTGLPTVADDSGLCVDALDGGPGVRTRRFAPRAMAARHGRDEANNRYLLQRLRGIPEEERGARFRCVVAVETESESFTLEGEVRGRIATEIRGEGGFGYDPVFVLPERDRSFGELPCEVKAERSHRADAFRKLRPWLEKRAEAGGG